MQWKEISKKTVYENPWIEVSESEVLTPKGKKEIYGKVHFKKKTVGILPIIDENKTILVGQHRFPTDSYSWEIPMGGVDLDEVPLDAAKRELKEETGIVADKWVKFLHLETSNSVSDEEAIVFYCHTISMVEQNPDDAEILEMKILDFNESLKKVNRREIKDAVSIAAILKMNLILDNNNLG